VDRARPLTRRFEKVWALGDQVLSSLTNFIPGFYAAHVLTPRDFAVFGLIQIAYVLASGVIRSLFSSVAMVSTPASAPTRTHLGSIDAAGMTAIGLAGAALIVLTATVDVPAALLTLTVAGIAFALIQDAVRLVSIATRHARHAALNDGLWLVAVVVVLPLLSASNVTDPWMIAAAWALASVPGLGAGIITTGWRARPRRGLAFVADNRRLSVSFLGEWTLKQGASQLAIYGIGLVTGVLAIAKIRASQLLLGPLNVLFTGAQMVILPAATAARDESPERMNSILRVASVVLAAAPLALAGFVAVVPETWLRVVLGQQAVGVEAFLAPLAVSLAATGLMTGSLSGLRVLHAGGSMVVTRFWATVLTLGAGVVGYAATRDVLGGLWGLALGNIVSVLLWERSYRAALGRVRA
jgi:hypothetical protein